MAEKETREDTFERIMGFAEESGKYEAERLHDKKLEIYRENERIAEVVSTDKEGVDAVVDTEDGYEDYCDSFSEDLKEFYRDKLDIQVVITED